MNGRNPGPEGGLEDAGIGVVGKWLANTFDVIEQTYLTAHELGDESPSISVISSKFSVLCRQFWRRGAKIERIRSLHDLHELYDFQLTPENFFRN
jgi:hypothetical protein